MKTILAVATCLVAFSAALVVSSFIILFLGGARIFLLQALLKPAFSAFVATYAVEKVFSLDSRLPLYTIAGAVILFVGYLQAGKRDAFAAYNLLATGTFMAVAIGMSYLASRWLRRSR